jgi:hypothetical protein
VVSDLHVAEHLQASGGQALVGHALAHTYVGRQRSAPDPPARTGVCVVAGHVGSMPAPGGDCRHRDRRCGCRACAHPMWPGTRLPRCCYAAETGYETHSKPPRVVGWPARASS